MNKVHFFLLYVFLFSCGNESRIQPDVNNKVSVEPTKVLKTTLPTYVFPQVKDLDSYANTEFLPTLESDLDKNKNAVYAASLLMAWDEIEKIIGSDLSDFDSEELEEMFNSTSHKKVLLSNEYKTEIEIEGTQIIAKAEFSKALPFSYPLTKNNEMLMFGQGKVNSFGFRGAQQMTRIVFYNSDNDFCISITPRDAHHSIYLLKSDKYESTFRKNFDKIGQKRRKQSDDKYNQWKKYLKSTDVAKIPMIEFNVNANYPRIENSEFLNSSFDRFRVLKAIQRTAFILNEKGAIVESEALMAVDAASEAIGAIENMPTPKNLIFDKKFMVFLKREKAEYPYFAVQITDTELLTK